MARRDPQREQQWRRTIQQWEQSGETIRGFCHGRGVAEGSFHAWRRELRRRDGGRQSSAADRGGRIRRSSRNGRARSRSDASNGPRPSQRFVQLALAPSSTAATENRTPVAPSLELVLDELVIRVPASLDAARLTEIIVAARRAATAC